ncbi:carbohydrate porin [Enterovirga sp.]|uniref:carbohydrate porin n=1 Tax=Enterovirga sp. TaxID=2026350 RepID=UPI00262F31F9|nr:carbohydrate porin [Enterovirga sp.]
MRGPLAGATFLLLAGPVAAQTLGQAGNRADPGPADLPAQAASTGQPAEPDSQGSISTSLPAALADPAGLRSTLKAAGITSRLIYIGEGFGLARGGIRRGGSYQGRLEWQLDADLDTLAGLSGLALHGNLYQIHGHGLSGCCLGNLLTTSSIDALPATRLSELWAEQKLFDDKVAIRAGQLAADAEFLVSDYAGLFVNATFGWPGIAAANLPNGGPAYPTATPGIRLKLAPADQVAVMAAVFNGDPVGPGGQSPPQRRDRSGFEFRTSDAALLMGEVAYGYGQAGAEPRLPGTVKLGGWHHLGRFGDQRTGTDGLSLADPNSGGIARRLSGNSGVYGVVDQLLYRVPGTADGGVGMFVRASASPGDRNLVSAYLDGGITFKGLLPGRPADTFGVAAGYAAISPQARGLDRDAQLFGAAAGAPFGPRRSREAVIEATYQAQIVPGFTIQPDVQHVIRPGGNVANRRDPNGAPVRNATVLGLRASLRY